MSGRAGEALILNFTDAIGEAIGSVAGGMLNFDFEDGPGFFTLDAVSFEGFGFSNVGLFDSSFGNFGSFGDGDFTNGHGNEHGEALGFEKAFHNKCV